MSERQARIDSNRNISDLDLQLNQDMQYWVEKLSKVIGRSNLNLDHHRPAIYSGNKNSVELDISGELYDKLSSITGNRSFLIYTILMAVLKICLYKYTGSTTIVVGSPTRKFGNDLYQSTNAIAIVDDINPKLSFQQFLPIVRQTLLDAYSRQFYPFARLIRDLKLDDVNNRCPIFDIALTLNGFHTDLPKVKNDINIIFNEQNYQLSGMVIFNSDLYELKTIKRFTNHFLNLLKAAINNIKEPIYNLQMMDDIERNQLLVEWNRTERDFSKITCIHEIFQAQAAKSADAVAVIFADQQLTYRELNNRANQLAHYLNHFGVRPEVKVGLCVERSLDMIVGILAILKAGGVYVPLDPAYPKDRLAYIMADSEMPIVITQEKLVENLPDHKARIIYIDSHLTAIQQMSYKNPTNSVTPENLAYIIYTSGSTGMPKGVLVEHRGMFNLSEAQLEIFNLQKEDHILQFSSLNFDASIFEIIMALKIGATLYLTDQHSLMPGPGLIRLLKEQHITTITIPPSVLEILPTEVLPALHTIIVAGEACHLNLVERWASGRRFFNAYGPTEATVWATTAQCLNNHAKPNIGRPIANTQIYILDRDLEPVPIGVAGELHITGEGVTRGYLNRPDLTSEKFIPNPFTGKPGTRLYKTGDLARYLPDGNIEFLERIDTQVKVRGFRIELGEIEAVLSEHPAIDQAVVLTKDDDSGKKRLVAFLLAKRDIVTTSNELKNYLRQRLPEYMLPAGFVMLERMPLTPNGKINKSALLALNNNESTLEENTVAARTPIEELLVGIWEEVLGQKCVSTHHNFFELGGHSLSATQVLSRLLEVFQVELPLNSMFEAPTVAGLAEKIEIARRAKEESSVLPLKPIQRDKFLPTSFAQQRLWFLHQMEPDNAFYNISMGIRISGNLDRDVLLESFNRIIDRHESLRTVFVNNNGTPVQIISESGSLTIPLINLTDLPDDEREAKAQMLIEQESQKPFELSGESLLRATLLQLSEEVYILLIVIHHIISDGWSMGLLLKELAIHYQSLLEGRSLQLSELPIQYADFSVWQREWLQGEVLQKQLSYWKSRLDGAPTVFELPTDRARPVLETFRGAKQSFLLSKTLTEELKTLSRKEGCTLFMTLLAAFKVLLYRYTNQQDIVIGSPIANRNRHEIENLIGFFVNMLVLRTDLSGRPTFRKLLARVREVALGAYEHQDLPFEKLVEELLSGRDTSRNPLFQVVFALHNNPLPVIEISGLTLNQVSDLTLNQVEIVDNKTAKFDLILHMWDKKEGIVGELEYNSDLFDPSTIERVIENFKALLTSITEYPDRSISDIPILSRSENQRILVEWNNTSRDYPKDRCIHELFEEQVERSPNAVAVTFQQESLSYAELNQRANQLAHYLRELGIGTES
ncbi:MAG: amino acid adenylation domain-containing protein, partial [Acidobacteriota bacterium]